MVRSEGRGRPREYCRRSCRQRAFEARRRLTELGWGESHIRELVSRMDEVHVLAQGAADVLEELRGAGRGVERQPEGDGWGPDETDGLSRLDEALHAILAATRR